MARAFAFHPDAASLACLPYSKGFPFRLSTTPNSKIIQKIFFFTFFFHLFFEAFPLFLFYPLN
jgi:hypothetical protein